MEAKNEDKGYYGPIQMIDPVSPTEQQADDLVIAEALRVLGKRIRNTGRMFTAPQDIKDYLVLQYGPTEHEVFGCVFLSSQHQFIGVEKLFRGSLSQTSVYPREVIKRALAVNAGAVILFHNHPSGMPEPSRADELLTQSLKTALAMVDIRVLDHIVVGGTSTVSFAERGLI